MKLDILVIAAHPDDAELGAGGTIIKAVESGKKVGILDLTRGEMGTRGTVETRKQESEASSKILGVLVRENVGLPDGFLANSKEFQMRILPFLRKYRPEIVLTNAVSDRHPDHGKGSILASDACFLSGLRALKTTDEAGNEQEAWRPKVVYHFVQDHYLKPDFVVDVTGQWEKKIEAIHAFKTQFYDPNSSEPKTPISTPDFMHFLNARGREYGRMIGVSFAEGFTAKRPVGVDSLFDLI